MTIIVNNVAAVNGGALSVLNDFISSIQKSNNKTIYWIILLGTLKYESFNNISFISFPWIKKSWFHRLYFDFFYGPILVRKLKGDYVFSLQNMIFPFCKVDQICYFHNALPFSEYRFGIFSNFKFWIYQNLIKYLYIFSFFKSKIIIVQSNWMKVDISHKLNIVSDKIFVFPPKINFLSTIPLTKENRIEFCFFYPASSVSFKNHKIIVEASRKLKDVHGINIPIVFTLKGNENKLVKSLKKIVDFNELNISFIGQISREKVFLFYQNSVLVFPSFIESSPYPLSEASQFNSIIFAADLKYSKETLDNYKNSYYFNPNKVDELVNLFLRFVNGEIEKSKTLFIPKNRNDVDLIDFVIKFIK
jgi:glycosyltransferase involved in cell wall biosynthesis